MNQNYFDCLIPAKLAFMCAIKNIGNYLPLDYRTKYFNVSTLDVFNTTKSNTYEMKGLKEAFNKLYKILYEKIEDVEYLSIILSTGINIREFKEFEFLAQKISFSIGGIAYSNKLEQIPKKEDLEWVVEFVAKTIINWQLVGVKFTIPEEYKLAVEKTLKSGGATFV